MANFFKVSAAWMNACGYGNESKTFEIISTRDFGSRGKFYTVIHNGREWEVWDIRGELVEPESTSPVEVVNEYTAIKLAESVADQPASTRDFFVILSANIVVAGCSTLELAAQRMNVMSHDDGHVTAIHFTGLTQEQQDVIAHETLVRRDSKQMTGRKFAKALGFTHAFKSRSQLNSEWEAQEAQEWLSDSPAPEGWTSVEGGAKLTWGESDSLTRDPSLTLHDQLLACELNAYDRTFAESTSLAYMVAVIRRQAHEVINWADAFDSLSATNVSLLDTVQSLHVMSARIRYALDHELAGGKITRS